MDNFQKFATALNKRFTQMSKGELYVVGDPLDRDSTWLTYLDSFPEGTNPMFRERTEHDDSMCRQFVKNIGNVVEIVETEEGLKIRTVWDNDALSPDSIYHTVADKMNEFVLSLPLTGIFRASERSYGAEKTHALVDGVAESWNHFHAKIANKHFSNNVGADRGNFDASVQVLGRGLEELSLESLETVADLIDSNSLYRGEEHLSAVVGFRSLKRKYDRASDKFAFVYANANSPAARFRNTVIGTLVEDLSKGVGLEDAVRQFESKVAPTNYKRPKALITPGMVKSAMKTVNDLGIERSLERRFAKLSDLSVNNVLWVNNDTQARMKDGIEGLLMEAATSTPRKYKGEPEKMSIVQFMKDILPGASAIELLVKNKHEPNFVSMTTGVHEDAPRLFKWDNSFAWSYGGNVADSIKERVKKAGGNVTAKLRVSLSWFNYDDLDIHVDEPNGNHIYYGHRDGKLDIDMNAGGGSSRTAVENVTWNKDIQDGDYRVTVNNFAQRETVDVGFVIQTESNGVIEEYHYDQMVKNRETVTVGTMVVKDGEIKEFKKAKGIQGGSASKEVWGIKTEQFVPVSVVTYSPNYFDDASVGNKHYFFLLKGCENDQSVRGIFNEYLRNELTPHRKAFEVLADKTKVAPSEDQLSGVGFSSTGGGDITARCTMKTGQQRLVNINF